MSIQEQLWKHLEKVAPLTDEETGRIRLPEDETTYFFDEESEKFLSTILSEDQYMTVHCENDEVWDGSDPHGETKVIWIENGKLKNTTIYWIDRYYDEDDDD